MRGRTAVLAAACLVVVMLMEGCGSVANNSATSLTSAEAKKLTQAMEREIAASVPTEDTAKIDQLRRGSFLSCDAHTIQWTGQTLVYFAGKPDVEAILDRINARWSGRAGFEVARGKAADGTPRLTIAGPNQSFFIVGPNTSHTDLEIESSSQCFKPTGNEAPGDFY